MGSTHLSKLLRAATTVSFAKSYDTETLANQSTTALRITRKSACVSGASGQLQYWSNRQKKSEPKFSDHTSTTTTRQINRSTNNVLWVPWTTNIVGGDHTVQCVWCRGHCLGKIALPPLISAKLWSTWSAKSKSNNKIDQNFEGTNNCTYKLVHDVSLKNTVKKIAKCMSRMSRSGSCQQKQGITFQQRSRRNHEAPVANRENGEARSRWLSDSVLLQDNGCQCQQQYSSSTKVTISSY